MLYHDNLRHENHRREEGLAIDIHWLPLKADAAYARDAVKLADAYGGVKAFHLSHLIVHHADDLARNPEQLENARTLHQLFREHGFDVWCWTHEIRHPPAECIAADGRLDLDHPRLPDHLGAKYRDVLTEFLPGLRGLVLTFAETQFEVYKERSATSRRFQGDGAPAQKTGWLINQMQQICGQHGIELTIRDFVYRMHEVEAMLTAIAGVDDRVHVMSKCVPHDWQPYYPDNPVLGQTGAKRQWIEFDLGHEYEMQGVAPFAEPALLWRRIRLARALGIDTFCLRLDRYGGEWGESAVYTPWGQLELQVFSRVARDHAVTLKEILTDWEAEHFPGAWDIVGLSTEVVRRMLFPERLWIANHSNLPTFDYAREHIKGGRSDRLPTWTHDPKDQLTEQLCDQPTAEWYRLLQRNDEKTTFYLRMIDQIIEDRGIRFKDDSVWARGLDRLKSWEELFRLFKQAYFAIRLHQRDPDAIPVRALHEKVDDLESACARYKERHPGLRLTRRLPWEAHPKVIASLREVIGIRI